MTSLYIFVTSETPDSYINVIAHTTEYLDVSSVSLVAISEHDYSEKNSTKGAQISANINRQLKALLENRYIKFDEDSGKSRSITIDSEANLTVYKRCLDFINSRMSHEVVQHAYLDKRIREYIQKEPNCIIDVTSLKNNLLIDVVVLLISYHFENVYNFELASKPTFNGNSLYHNLENKKTYRYRKLTKSIPITKSLRRLDKLYTRKKSVIFVAALLLALLIPLSFHSPNSIILTTINVIALVATISSWFLTFTER